MSNNNKEITEDLLREFPADAHKGRKGGGGRTFTYVETHSYILRLIKTTDNSYDWKINSFKIEGGLAILTGTLTIPGLGSRDGIGVQVCRKGDQGDLVKEGTEDLIKAVNGDALKAASKLFGVCLYLYGEDYEGEENIKEAHQPAPPVKQIDPLIDAKLHYAKKCQEFFKGNKLDGKELWAIYQWAVADGKEKPEEAAIDDWLSGATEASAALGSLAREIGRLKSGQGNMHESKRTAVDAGFPEALWQKLFSVTPGGAK